MVSTTDKSNCSSQEQREFFEILHHGREKNGRGATAILIKV